MKTALFINAQEREWLLSHEGCRAFEFKAYFTSRLLYSRSRDSDTATDADGCASKALTVEVPNQLETRRGGLESAR